MTSAFLIFFKQSQNTVVSRPYMLKPCLISKELIWPGANQNSSAHDLAHKEKYIM